MSVQAHTNITIRTALLQLPEIYEVFYGKIEDWDVSNVTDMTYLFKFKSAFNDDIGNWDVSSVTNMEGLFYSAVLFNQNISGWNVSNVTNMASMFQSANAFNQDLSAWDVSNVTNMQGLFMLAESFDGISISGWNTSNVKTMSKTFMGAILFNGDISGWNTSTVTMMDMMFEGAASFDQDLSKWDVYGVFDNSLHLGHGDFHKGVLHHPETYMFGGAMAFLPNVRTYWPTDYRSLYTHPVDPLVDISVLLETIHSSIFETNNTIINRYFDAASRTPKMMQFVYGGTKIDVPSIFMNPPNLFGLEEVTMTTSGSSRVGVEYKFRKDVHASTIFNDMLPNKIYTSSE